MGFILHMCFSEIMLIYAAFFTSVLQERETT